MRKLRVFNSVSLDGYFTDANNDYSFAHEGANDPDLLEFTKGNAQGKNALVFGRLTYELMAAWWPTPEAAKAMPEIAKGMNEAAKYVFSRTLGSAEWSNTTLLKDDPETAIARIKQTPGPGMTVLGSGTIVAQLAAAGLIDEVQLLVCPVVLGSGKSQFAGVTGKPRWTLSRSKTFKNGRVFLAYSRAT
ncbi:dihydrofolate reductase family protein [Mesorhizobium sp. YC-39]|uniref:dihydrofolate reductase family protein n=1 Tax=unclassified Mesorhizobium TaxID=325217 RepID=UPI0021E73238|nr:MULTISPECIES: dihydrofolate reductase family protein [unclassified Mesorhizobium]MCV3208742.1 dihydrofolate reductase family protein [Mesorhizobium sp. YC-2]MCV3231909.1 dihydrofolate reductase family protein [Mesorhizobium sp. YC-39]